MGFDNLIFLGVERVKKMRVVGCLVRRLFRCGVFCFILVNRSYIDLGFSVVRFFKILKRVKIFKF